MPRDRKSRWKLATVSNVCLLALYLAGSVTLVAMVNSNARQQALRNAELYSRMILDRNALTHSFFNNALKTSLYSLFEGHFNEPHWMSATFAINSLDKDYGLFTEGGLYYKESVVNARNQANEADTQESAFIDRLNADLQLSSESAIGEYGGQPFFTVMRRGQVVKQECLRCHGDPADAPPGIVEHYGSESGFNRREGETLSAISIRIPLALAYQDANRFSLKLSGFLLALLLTIFAFQYMISRQLLFAPIGALCRKAQRIAHDPEHLGDELPLPFGHELVELVEAFNSMSVGLSRHQEDLERTIRERTAALEETNLNLEELRRHHEMILNATSEGILGLDRAGRVTFLNRSAQTLLGIGAEAKQQLTMRDLAERLAGDEGKEDPAVTIGLVLTGGVRAESAEGLIRRADGRQIPIQYSCVPLRGGGAVLSFGDITERRRTEREIQQLAFYDQLTGLPNRTLFYDRIAQRVAQAERDRQRLALMFLDLDDFKVVNDTLGHAAGDEFLKEIARRLRAGSRQADTVARLGGDEFVWFGEIDDEESAALIAGKFLEGLSRPVRLGEHNFFSTASIGIAIFPDSARDVGGLVKCADSAMYTVKQGSKNAYRFYRREHG